MALTPEQAHQEAAKHAEMLKQLMAMSPRELGQMIDAALRTHPPGRPFSFKVPAIHREAADQVLVRYIEAGWGRSRVEDADNGKLAIILEA